MSTTSIPSDWTQWQVRDLVSSHFSGPSPTCEEREIQTPLEWGLLKTTAITWEHGWNWHMHKVPPRQYWQRSGIEIHSDDVIVTKAGPRHRVGVVAYVQETPDRLMVSGKMVALRPRQEIVEPAILAEVLALPGPQKYLDHNTTGMAESQVNFTNEDLLATTVDLPSRNEQRRITSILNSVDAAAKRQEKSIEKIRAVKVGLLHELLSCGIGEDGRLRSAADDPAMFVRTDLGVLPAQWDVIRLADIMSRAPSNGYSPREANEDTGTRMLGLGCLTPTGFRPTQIKYAPAGDRGIERALLQDGDLLVSRSNTRALVGLAGIYSSVGAPCIYPDLMMRLEFAPVCSPQFAEYILRWPPVRRQLVRSAVGTSESMVKISGKTVRELVVPLPSREEQDRIVHVIRAVDRRIVGEEAVEKKLRNVRRGLMFDLLTGKVRVPVEEVRC